MIISYELGNRLYLNITNKCSNACEFCLRNGISKNSERWETDSDLIGTPELWLEREPSVDEVIADLEKRYLSRYKEVVFCGFGEPFERFYDCLKIAEWLKSKGLTVRVNTNGQVNLICKENVIPKMKGIFDVVSVSLNAPDAHEYQSICHSEYGEDAYYAMLDFAKGCSESGINVIMSVVSTIGEEKIEICRRIAEQNGASLRVREIIE